MNILPFFCGCMDVNLPDSFSFSSFFGLGCGDHIIELQKKGFLSFVLLLFVFGNVMEMSFCKCFGQLNCAEIVGQVEKSKPERV